MIKENRPSQLMRIMTIIIILTSFAACSTISTFDQHAYTQTTSLKVDALNIMSMASDDFNTHVSDVKTLKTNLQKAYEYEKNRPLNKITMQMWDKLLNPEGHLLGGFLQRWEEKGSMNEVFVNEAKKQVAEAFDLIAALESGKIKPKDIKQ
jgi:hypothetical protein